MNKITLSEVLTRSAAAMVADGDDVTGALAELLRLSITALGATAGGILVQRLDGPVELLAATSHRAADLEVAQLQADEGPCLDSLRDGVPVRERGREALTARWPSTGPQIIAAGYETVHATPMIWRGQSFGGFNIFWGPDALPTDEWAGAQAVADVATMLIVSKGGLPEQALSHSLSRALTERIVVERAKGALVHVQSLDPARAYDALIEIAAAENATLGAAARMVLDRATGGTLV